MVEDLDRIRGAGRHLLDLINDILDLSKIEAGKMDLHIAEFELESVVRDVTATINPLVVENDNILNVEVNANLPKIHSDLTKTRQILFNLLSNASKFTQAGQVFLRVELVDSNPLGQPAICLEVRDEGIGISEEQRSRLFQPFMQAEKSTAKTYGGTGLGLTLSSKFAKMLGGTIELESELGIGSTFRVYLPLDSTRSAQEPPAVRPISHESHLIPASAPVVLVVDDDPNTIHLLGRLLEPECVRVISAMDGVQGLEMARHENPDLILLDILMPIMDGWTTLSAIKADPKLAGIPIMICTVTDSHELALSHGITDYVAKPIDRTTFLRTTRRVLGLEHGEILVVDDDENHRTLVRRILVSAGFAVNEAKDGKEALAIVREAPPRMILLDLLMPVMDGFEFIQCLRNGDDPEIPVLLLTNKDLCSEEKNYLTQSAVRTLAKQDFSPEKVRQLIMAMLEGPSPTPQAQPLDGSPVKPMIKTANPPTSNCVDRAA